MHSWLVLWTASQFSPFRISVRWKRVTTLPHVTPLYECQARGQLHFFDILSSTVLIKTHKRCAVSEDINITEWIVAGGFVVARGVLENASGCVKSIAWHCVSLTVSVHQADLPSLVSERNWRHCSYCKSAKIKTAGNITTTLNEPFCHFSKKWLSNILV